ncbi:hypothetical protein CSUI_005830, partial [Cystoisospora suis]
RIGETILAPAGRCWSKGGKFPRRERVAQREDPALPGEISTVSYPSSTEIHRCRGKTTSKSKTSRHSSLVFPPLSVLCSWRKDKFLYAFSFSSFASLHFLSGDIYFSMCIYRHLCTYICSSRSMYLRLSTSLTSRCPARRRSGVFTKRFTELSGW